MKFQRAARRINNTANIHKLRAQAYTHYPDMECLHPNQADEHVLIYKAYRPRDVGVHWNTIKGAP